MPPTELFNKYPLNLVNENFHDLETINVKALNKIINERLSDRQRYILERRFRDEVTVREIASELGIHFHSVYRIMNGALHRIDRLIDKYCEVDVEELYSKINDLDYKLRLSQERCAELQKKLNELEAKLNVKETSPLDIVPCPDTKMIGTMKGIKFRTFNLLYGNGFRTAGDVRNRLTQDIVLSIKGFGPKTIENMLTVFKAYGVELKKGAD